MKVIWIDKKSILTSGRKKFKAGDIIPGGLLTASRIDELVKSKKIKIEGESKVEEKKVESKKPEPEIKSEKPETKSYETKKVSIKEEVKKIEEPSLIDEEIDLGI